MCLITAAEDKPSRAEAEDRNEMNAIERGKKVTGAVKWLKGKQE